MRKLILALLLTSLLAVSASAALKNVSVGKQATASSVNGSANAGFTTDGVVAANYPSIYHSAGSDADPWLMVDLGQLEMVKEVMLWNRVECCQLRLQDIQIEILDGNQNILYTSELLNPGNILEGPMSVTLSLENTIPGQYVRVRRIPYAVDGGDGNVLSINELQVFADGEVASVASVPSPYIGEVDVPLEVTLSWDASMLDDPDDELPPFQNPAVVKHILLLSNEEDVADPNLILKAEIDAGEFRVEYGPIAIERDGIYYWRVDQMIPDSNDPGQLKAITGNVWQFNAVTSFPGIDAATPVEQIIDPGDDAVFSVSATNPITEDTTGLSYAWFKVDPAGDISVGDNSDTLTLVDPATTDEVDYYCIVTVVANGNSTTSGSANLTIKRLVHHWPFDGDLEDIVGGRDGVMVGDPDLSYPGISGEYAVDLDSDDAIYVGGDMVALDSYSISVWINHRGLSNNFHSVIHNDGWSSDAESGSLHFHLRSDESFSWGINGAGGDGRTAAGTIPDPDKWYHLVLSYRFGQARAYVDGLLVAEAMAATPNRSRILPGTIGAYNQNDRFIDARMDDMRIYNYPLSDIDIAMLNFEATGVPVCVFPPVLDLNGDCRETLEDFAILAANWIKCNRVPFSSCD